MSAETHGSEAAHPGPKTYATIAAILFMITLAEFGAFYAEFLKPVYVPLLVAMSGAKFALVVMFFMHLKFDHKIFSRILLSGVVLGFVVMLWLLALFTFSHPLLRA
ncbi:MAG: cytochrome C oxidase subunit IV family protein [bacterium]